MLTQNSVEPSGYEIAYHNGNIAVQKDLPIANPTIKSITALHKRIERKGFTDLEILAYSGANDAHPATKEYIIKVARRMMGELQSMGDSARPLQTPALPEYLKAPFDVKNSIPDVLGRGEAARFRTACG
jgi:hypothetical protein